jgi:hypothetical protein
MNNTFLVYIELVILVVSLVMACVFSVQFSRQAILPLRRVPLFFLISGMTTVISAMLWHSGNIAYQAILQVLADTFVYDFTFYALNLMSIVFLAISIHMLLQVKVWVSGDLNAKNRIIRAAIALILLSVPTIPFSLTGLLPAISSIVSLIALPFVIKVVKRELQQIY